MTPRSASSLVVVGTSSIAVCYGFARFAYGLLAPEMTADLDLSGGLAGVIAAGSYVGYCVGILASSAATPLSGPRRAATAAVGVAVAGTLTVALAPNAVVLAVGILVAGISTGAASPPLAAAVALQVAESRRDRAQTVVNAGTGLGVALSAPVVLAVGGDWRTAWAVFAALALLVAVGAWVVVPDGDGAGSGPGRLVPPRAEGSIRLVAVAAAMGAVSVAMWTFGRELVQTVGGMEAGASSWFWIALGAAGAVGAVGGDLASALGAARLWRLLLVAMSGATAALALWPSGAAAFVAAAVFGASYIALSGLVLVGASRVWPDQVGAGVGVAFFAIAVGQAAAAPLVGGLGDRWGLPVAFGVAAVVGLIASAVALPDGPARSTGDISSTTPSTYSGSAQCTKPTSSYVIPRSDHG